MSLLLSTSLISEARPGEYHGNVTGEMVRKVFMNKFIPQLAGGYGVIFTDNASVYKEYVQNIYEMDEDALVGLIMIKGQWKNSMGLWDKARLQQFIRQHGLRDRALEKLCADCSCLWRALPRYWHEANPIEKLWRLVKYHYKRLPKSMHWKVRLHQAQLHVTVEYVQKIVSGSIKFCLSKHCWFKGYGVVHRAPGAPEAAPVAPVALLDESFAEFLPSDEEEEEPVAPQPKAQSKAKAKAKAKP